MTEIIFVIEDDPSGGYIDKAIGESIYTQGETIEELREMIRDAVRCHYDDSNRPQRIRLHSVCDEVIAS